MIRSALILLMTLMPLAAMAGPWPREAGRSFLSLSTERDVEGNRYTGLYGEYGLAATTLGLELGRSGAGELSAVVWAQRSLDDGTGPHRLSLSAGAGVIRRQDRVLPVVQGTLAWGRGFEGWAGGGWMTAQLTARAAGGPDLPEDRRGTAAARAFRIAETTLKADLTLGLRPTERLRVVNSLWLEDRRDAELTAKLASSLVFPITGPAHLEVGLVQPLRGPAERAVRLGVWLDF
ncbi:hypothetical protein FA743_16740 [Paracoccus gahaiensis]|uniref:DUF481 domain-containing protein n=1 Tax=Paracoccus gahaiensis TaxID=1706839 RepID=A0A4U0R6T2_9RHOB|nr:hypothetical protein [Paracoccus gahaiensis]TJZ90002.1 hypothetical protein FA743_16740 [Paracoccus gahaiensis]